MSVNNQVVCGLIAVATIVTQFACGVYLGLSGHPYAGTMIIVSLGMLFMSGVVAKRIQDD